MPTDDLLERIQNRRAKLGVIGLGYVGLPVAALLAEVGFQVIGVDVKPERVSALNLGECVIGGNEPGLADLVAKVVDGGRFKATTAYESLSEAEVVIIAVETPVDAEDHLPKYQALKSACESLGKVLKEGALVIVESTIAPGTIDNLVAPLLEETSGMKSGEGFHLVACPERVMPGVLLHNMRHMNRVVGGTSPHASELASNLYAHVVEGDLDKTDALTAEIVKTAENTYRDVQIAFANEVALLCESLGADVWRVRELVNKSPGRDMHLPGAGVGGHCIPKDPWLLIANAGENFDARLIPAARAVNDAMPLHILDTVRDALAKADVPLAGSTIAVLGFAYRENTDDTRNSPSKTLVDALLRMGASVRIHDPFVSEYVGDLHEVVSGSDAVVLMVAHELYESMDLGDLRRRVRTPILVDGRNAMDRVAAKANGFDYRLVGRGGRDQ